MKLLPFSQFPPALAALGQPQWIAALLSVGFHGVLFAAGPSFSTLGWAAPDGTDPTAERRVPLIELTPEEQGRLPDFSPPSASLFPSGDEDLFSLFPPSGSTLPPSPGPGFSSTPALPAPRVPTGSFRSSLPPFPLSNRTTLSIPSARYTLPSLPRGTGSSTAAPAAPGDRPAQGETPAAAPGTAAPAPTENAPANGASSGANPGATPPPTEESPTAAERASELLARVEYSETQTSDAEVEFARAAWLSKVKEQLGEDVVQAEEPITLEVPYTGRLCLDPPPTEGILGLVGLPNEAGDKLVPWTAVLKSTGYPFLNQAAEQALKTLGQEEADASALAPNVVYQVLVTVDYSDQTCVSREELLQSRSAATDDNLNTSPEATPEDGGNGDSP